jgi:hypothetical protein
VAWLGLNSLKSPNLTIIKAKETKKCRHDDDDDDDDDLVEFCQL